MKAQTIDVHPAMLELLSGVNLSHREFRYADLNNEMEEREKFCYVEKDGRLRVFAEM